MNKKISELVAASSVTAADDVVLNQAGTTKKISIKNLFGSGVPVPVNIKGKFHFGATPENITTGAISLELPVTNLTLSGPNNITIMDGVEGQVKVIVATVGSGSATLTGNLYDNAILFGRVGASASLLFTGGKWAFVGGTAQAL